MKFYQVDAFTKQVFSGNPAVVCPLDAWLPDELMQKIANEHNLSETVFFVAEDGGFRIRWFTPVAEIELCGHATLASAHVLYEHLGYAENQIDFISMSGPLAVKRDSETLALDFPARPVDSEVAIPAAAEQALGLVPQKAFGDGEKLMLVYANKQEIAQIKPQFSLVAQMAKRNVMVTAPGDAVDFVCRVFVPNLGINEDPVTGSAYTSLVPYWSKRLAKKTLTARQLSARGGEVFLQNNGERIAIGGHAVTVLEGEYRFAAVP